MAKVSKKKTTTKKVVTTKKAVAAKKVAPAAKKPSTSNAKKTTPAKAATKSTPHKSPAKPAVKKKAVVAPAPVKKIEPTEDQIRQRARQLWLEQGRPVGQDEEIWLEAERRLREEG